MESIEGLEIWEKRQDGGVPNPSEVMAFVLVVSRAPSGVYTGWKALLDGSGPTVDEVKATILSTAWEPGAKHPLVDYPDLTAVAKRDMEFRSHAAAAKWARRSLTQVVAGRGFDRDAATSDRADEWSPDSNWRRVYDGTLRVQHFEANAAQSRTEAKIAKIEKEIEAAGKVDPGTLTDEQYTAHRRRKVQLRMERAKLQGGDNA